MHAGGPCVPATSSPRSIPAPVPDPCEALPSPRPLRLQQCPNHPGGCAGGLRSAGPLPGPLLPPTTNALAKLSSWKGPFSTACHLTPPTDVRETLHLFIGVTGRPLCVGLGQTRGCLRRERSLPVKTSPQGTRTWRLRWQQLPEGVCTAAARATRPGERFPRDPPGRQPSCCAPRMGQHCQLHCPCPLSLRTHFLSELKAPTWVTPRPDPRTLS